MSKVQTKISRAQYKALLLRALDKSPVEAQTSQAMQMQNMLGGLQEKPTIPQGSVMPAQPIQPVQAPAQPIGLAPAAREQNVAVQAAMVWKELEGSLGEALWQRLLTSSGVSASDPGQAFVQAAVAYSQEPQSIPDERVKKFIEAVMPADTISPTANLTGPAPERLTEIIKATMR